MTKQVPPPRSPRNFDQHLAVAAGQPGAFEQLFAELPTEPEPADLDLEDDGIHEPLCPCWRCDTSPVFYEKDEDEAFDMARDLAQDRDPADDRWLS